MNKKAKKGNAGIVLFLIALAVVFFLFIFPTGTTTKDFLEVRMYDSDGNLIGSTESFAVVDGVPGVQFIDLTINVDNDGEIPLDISITSLSPTQFNNALSKTTKTAQPGDTVSWVSSLINVDDLGLGSKIFSVSVRGDYVYGGISRQVTDSDSITITFEEDLEGSLSVSVEGGGEGSIEPPTGDYVNFRTSSLTYVSTIAYSPNCGSNLVGYGYYISKVGVSTTCNDKLLSYGYTKLLNNLPGGFVAGGVNPSLWMKSGELVVCDDDGGSTYKYIRFRTTDFGSSTLSLSPTTVDSSMEVYC